MSRRFRHWKQHRPRTWGGPFVWRVARLFGGVQTVPGQTVPTGISVARLKQLWEQHWIELAEPKASPELELEEAQEGAAEQPRAEGQGEPIADPEPELELVQDPTPVAEPVVVETQPLRVEPEAEPAPRKRRRAEG